MQIVESLESRRMMSATFPVWQRQTAQASQLTHAHRSALADPAVSNLVGTYAGNYSNTTVGQAGDVSVTVHQQVGRRLVLGMEFDGTEMFGRGTVKGRSVRITAA